MLQKAHAAASSFLKIYDAQRQGKGKGRPADAEQDLLRAMVVFATAGLDAMFKELVREALPVLLKREIGIKAFESFIARQSEGVGPVDHKFLAVILASQSPRESLVKAWIADLTSGSLQSVAAVMKTASALDISFSELIESAVERDALKGVFDARNQIVHEMDLEFSKTSARRFRKEDEMKGFAETAFLTAAGFWRRWSSGSLRRLDFFLSALVGAPPPSRSPRRRCAQTAGWRGGSGSARRAGRTAPCGSPRWRRGGCLRSGRGR